MKRAKVNAQSRKRRQLAPKRAHFVRDFLAKNPRCQVRWNGGCTGRAEHVHEPLTRARGGKITDPANAVATCFWCHAQLHAHPLEAEARGFLRSQFRGKNPDVVIVDDPTPADRLADAQARIRAAAERYGLGG